MKQLTTWQTADGKFFEKKEDAELYENMLAVCGALEKRGERKVANAVRRALALDNTPEHKNLSDAIREILIAATEPLSTAEICHRLQDPFVSATAVSARLCHFVDVGQVRRATRDGNRVSWEWIHRTE